MSLRVCVLCVLAFLVAATSSGPASATFHLFIVDQVFSNADGTVQYVVFRQTPPSNDEHEWMGHALVSVHDGVTQTLVYPSNLPTRITRGKRVLVATQGFADLGLVAPDYIMPSGFLGTGSGRLKCCDDGVNYAYTALPVDGVTALDGVQSPTAAVATNFAGASAPVSVSAPAGLDQNQHGLTGSWYEPATSGQGFEVEIFPNQPTAGTGYAQVSWFTYDSVVGGADRQRWYTMSGAIAGAAPATLTIYRNVGGNFNAAPVTSATVVGTATVRFDTCTSGLLTYAFTDGSARTGSIPLTRLTQNVTCAQGAAPASADFALSGNWYDAATAGQGITIEANPVSAALFFAWYTYAPAGASAGAAGQRWYTGSAPWTPGTRSVAVQLYETTGGMFDAPSVPPPVTASVGTGTLAFEGCGKATLAFAFTGGTNAGKSGTITLGRVGPVPAGCTAG